MDWITNPEHWIALITLVVLELVLGVDNIIFISILVGKLPQERQNLARTLGISLAVVTRILLLLFLSWVIGLTAPIFALFNHDFSGRDLILLGGGLFLLWKSTHEIHEKLEGVEGQASARVAASFIGVIIEIMLLDIVFSLDSVITAVGMSGEIAIMIIAVVIAAVIMIFVSKPIGDFVDHHPTVKMLALSFLLMIGFTLVAGGFGVEIPKGYIYFAMAFSVFVEMLNLRMRGKEVRPVNLREPYKAEKQPKLALAAESGAGAMATPAQVRPAASKPKKANTSNKKKKK
ncbi:MAG: TerC family protein [Chloroflexi bacterium]|nr:TerC family protein [Chloroflexota bacterium]